jgi:hypothetical protein
MNSDREDKASNKLADDLLRAGEKRGADEILGMDTENMSPSKVRRLLKNKGIKGLQEGGMAISDADIASIRRAFGSRGESGNTLSNADIARLQRFMTQETGNIPQSLRGRNRRRSNESANTISDRDIQMIMQSIGMEDGGEAVPAKFKGFSKLPEKVQQKMDPDLAQKYEKGGAVGSCRGMGAALRGGKFSGVK